MITNIKSIDLGSSIAFMFPGQGSQYISMAKDLFNEYEIFRSNLEECKNIIFAITNINLYEILYPQYASDDTVNLMNSIVICPLVIFSIEYSLAKLLISWEILPTIMIGHSLGEYVAATLSGVILLNDALMLIYKRACLMEKLPKGKMVGVPLSFDELQDILPIELSIAADHGSSCIVSGPVMPMTKFEKKLSEMKLLSYALNIERAGHSSALDLILNEYFSELSRIKLYEPKIPFISNVTGNPILHTQAQDPHYWVSQLRNTVKIDAGLSYLINSKIQIYLEIGPGSVLSMLVSQKYAENPDATILYLMRNPKHKISDKEFLIKKLSSVFNMNDLEITNRI